MIEALESNWVSYVGPHVQKFEQLLAEATCAPFAVAMNSGTSALHIALILSGVGVGHEVVMPAVSFVAPANAIRYCGAWPAFVDIRKDDWQMCADQTREFLRHGCKSKPEGLINNETGRVVKAIMLVHLLGGMGDVDAFTKIAEEFGLFLIEDAAECLGATYKNRTIAASTPEMDTSRRFVTTSFNGNKIVTTGEGGMLTTDDDALADKMRLLRGQGMDPKRRYWFPVIGYNYRMTNIQAAIGLGQMEQIDEKLSKRRTIGTWYNNELAHLSEEIELPYEETGSRHSYWMYNIFLKTGSEQRRDMVMKIMDQAGIETRPVFYPMHVMPPYAEATQYPVADSWACRGINLPTHEGLTESCVKRIANHLNQAIRQTAGLDTNFTARAA